MKTCPPQKFTDAITSLSVDEEFATKTLLRKVLHHYQNLTGRTAFGICQYCKFYQQTSDGIVCGLTKEALSSDDILLICKEYAV
jgi:hypothetical protein